MADVETKTCTACGEAKPIEDFHLDRTRLDGRQSRCKSCRRNARYVKLGIDPERPSWNQWWRERIIPR